MFYIIIVISLLFPLIIIIFDEWKINIFLNSGLNIINSFLFLLPSIVSFIYSLKTDNDLYYSLMNGINSLILLFRLLFSLLPRSF